MKHLPNMNFEKTWLGSLKAIVLTGLIFSPTMQASAETPASPTKRPNIILIQTDDQGYNDIDLFNRNELLETPALDSLTEESVQIRDFYLSPLCAPTRAATLTGRHHLKAGVWGVHTGADYVNIDETTFANVFQDAGYTTAHFGKWHSGKTDGYWPWDRGFDEGHVARLYNYYSHAYQGDPREDDSNINFNGSVEDFKYSNWAEEELAERAVRFIDEHKDDSEPFLIYYCPMSTHTGNSNQNETTRNMNPSWFAPERWVDYYREKIQAPPFNEKVDGKDKASWDSFIRLYAMLGFHDEQIGKIINKIDESGLRENTIIVYISDNGPSTDRNNGSKFQYDGHKSWAKYRAPDGVRGQKMSLWENGFRSYCLINRTGPEGYGEGPNHDQPRVIANVPCMAEDIFPTLVAMAGLSVPADNKPLDGVDLTPLLRGEPWEHEDRYIHTFEAVRHIKERNVFRLDEERNVDKSDPVLNYIPISTALRQGPWKLNRRNLFKITSVDELYPENIQGDTGHVEGKRIFDGEKKVEMTEELKRWWKEEILAEPGSFQRPTFQIGWTGSDGILHTSSRIYLYSPMEVHGDITTDRHFIPNAFKREGEYLVYPINVHRAGTYTPVIHFERNGTDTATFRISVGGNTTTGTIDGNEEYAFPEIELPEGPNELKVELVEYAGKKPVFQELQKMDLNYDG